MTFPYTPTDSVAYPAATWRLTSSSLWAAAGPLAVISGATSPDAFVGSLTGSALSIGPGRAVLQGATTATQGAYLAAMSATWSATVPAASSLGRIDLVILRVWDNEVDSSGLTQADLVYVTGTPSASPVAPTISSSSTAIPITQISVPHTGSPALVQAGVIPYTAAAGGIIPVANAASYPQAAETGQLLYNIATGRLLRWTGPGAATPVKTAPFAPVTQPVTASVACTSTGSTVATLPATITVDGATEIEIVATWAGVHMTTPVAGAALTHAITLNGVTVDKWFYAQPTGPASGIATGGASHSTRVTPAAGTYTIAWTGIVTGTTNTISVTASTTAITTLRAQPTLQ
jgi:hypothetical protein